MYKHFSLHHQSLSVQPPTSALTWISDLYAEPSYDPHRKRTGPRDYTHVSLIPGPGLKVKFAKGYPTRSASKRQRQECFSN